MKMKTNLRVLGLAATSALLTLSNAAFAKFHHYKLDPSHTRIGFSVKHLMFATVHGHFGKFQGTFDFDHKSMKLKNVLFSVDTASVDTDDEKRDEHLRSPDFFNVKKYPTMKFTFDKLTLNKKNKPKKLYGKLDLHGNNNKIVMNVDYKGRIKDPWENQRIIFNLQGHLDRRDYKIEWNKALDHGGVMIGNKVKLKINGEAIQVDKSTGSKKKSNKK